MVDVYLDSETKIPEEEIIAQQVSAIASLTPFMMIANIVNALTLMMVLCINGDLMQMHWVWASVAITIALLSLWKQYQRRNRPFPTRMSKGIKTRLILNASILGFVWSLPGLLILPYAEGTTQAFVITLAAGVISAGAITLYPIPIAALCFSGTIIFGGIVGFSFSGDPTLVGFAIISVVFVFVIMSSIIRHEQVFVSEFRSRRELAEKNQLIETLLDETRIQASTQQQATEAKLAQAQKLESIGTLTAGIAHDFNNILAVIMGNIELAQLDLKDEDLMELLTDANMASKRGADLTHRLLTFSRKAPLLPSVVDINEVTAAMQPLLARTFPASLEISFVYSPAQCSAKVDRSQLENAILNLVVNAHDAMEGKGTVIVQTRKIMKNQTRPPGSVSLPEFADYVQISVTDTGSGIPDEIREKVFEPFFTTKPVGKGSGLGLAMIYGFAKQSGGGVDLKSEVGSGTTTTLFFPSVEHEAVDEISADLNFSEDKRHSGTALVVEDNDAVRTVVMRQLTELGFTVEQAVSGDVAHRILMSGQKFDLVVTDVSMPGYMQGPTLSRFIADKFPDTSVVLMSGYPKDAFEELRSLTHAMPCLTKPVQFKELKRAIQSVLD